MIPHQLHNIKLDCRVLESIHHEYSSNSTILFVCWKWKTINSLDPSYLKN